MRQTKWHRGSRPPKDDSPVVCFWLTGDEEEAHVEICYYSNEDRMWYTTDNIERAYPVRKEPTFWIEGPNYELDDHGED